MNLILLNRHKEPCIGADYSEAQLSMPISWFMLMDIKKILCDEDEEPLPHSHCTKCGDAVAGDDDGLCWRCV